MAESVQARAYLKATQIRAYLNSVEGNLSFMLQI